MTKRPDNEVTPFAIKYRAYREAKKNGTWVPNPNYTPSFDKEELAKYNIAVYADENRFGYKCTKLNNPDYTYSIGVNNNGYAFIVAYNAETHKPRTFLLHRIVYVAFKGPIPVGYTVDHINYNKLDNSLDNLQLLTRAENRSKGDGIQRTKTKDMIAARKARVEAKRQARKIEKDNKKRATLQRAISGLEREVQTLEKRKARLESQMNRLHKITVHSENIHGSDSEIFKRLYAKNIVQFEIWKENWLKTKEKIEEINSIKEHKLIVLNSIGE